MLSCVLILPAILRDKGNALGGVMGWGPDNYSVALTNTTDPTHYGLHAWVTQSFVDLIDAGTMPVGLDYPQADFDEVMAALISSFRANMTGHFDEVCAAHGLSLVVSI